ncbi:MAG: glutamate--tRNA ligase family protein [Kofleriaceae bacterium]
MRRSESSAPGEVGRFAPSTTGDAHPGTLLAGLLAWLDGRARGARVLLRLEDLEVARTSAAHAAALPAALAWLGLDWDDVVVQSEHAAAHAAALDQLAAAGRLYPCECSRKDRAGGRRAPDGGWAYDNRCRARALPAGGWRACTEVVRARLDDAPVIPVDDGGLDLAQTPAFDMGDPIVRRRDGSVAYQLAVVVDDAAAGVTRVVRGRDLAPSTATQVALQRLLGLPTPRYRHHLLLLEPGTGGKLAKLHGSVGHAALRAAGLDGAALCGQLAYALGLTPTAAPTTPAALVPSFAWQRVRTDDLVARWDGARLALDEPPAPAA